MKPASMTPARLPLLVAALTLLPFVWCHAHFARLFYFQDELDLLDWRDRLGFFPWMGRMFAENFVPLFKLTWGGAIELFHGSYFALIMLVWLNHALNTALLARLLTTIGLSTPAAFFAAMIFGVSSLNLETLAWAVQWSAVQSITFLLLGLLVIVRSPRVDSASARFWLMLFALFSPLCFSRGVLTGPVLAGALLILEDKLNLNPTRLLTAACALLPSIGVGLLVTVNATGNHQHLGGHGADIASFAFHYFSGSPLHQLFVGKPMSVEAGYYWVTAKLLIMGAAVLLAHGRLRVVLVALAAFDLSNALLLGVGRYHTGLSAALSSRYQYTALLCLLPFCASLLDQVVNATGQNKPRLASMACWVAACFAIIWASQDWPKSMRAWQSWRGASLRAALAHPTDKAAPNFSGVPWISNERTRELVEKYTLH